MKRFSHLLPAAFEASAWDLNSHQITILVCYGVLFLSLHKLLRRYFIPGVKAPVVGRRFALEPEWLIGLRFTREGSPIINEGYRKVVSIAESLLFNPSNRLTRKCLALQFKDSMFKVRRTDGEILIIPNKHIEELRNIPDEKFSATAAQVKNLVGRYSTTPILLESDLHIRVIKKLTPMLGSTIPIVMDELDFAASVEIPDCKG